MYTQNEFGMTNVIKDAKRIFVDTEGYGERELKSYALLIRSILGVTSFETIKDNEIIISELSKSIQTLTQLETNVIALRYGLDDGITKTYATIGQKLGYTHGRIRQIEVKALRKMRHSSKITTFSVSKRNLYLENEQKQNANSVLVKPDS